MIDDDFILSCYTKTFTEITKYLIPTPFSNLFVYKYMSIPQDGTFLLATHTITNTYLLQDVQNVNLETFFKKKQDCLQTSTVCLCVC